MAKVVTAFRSAPEKGVSGKVALITDRTGGISAGTVRRMAGLGGKVVVRGRRIYQGQKTSTVRGTENNSSYRRRSAK